jgi:hypothetical protein
MDKDNVTLARKVLKDMHIDLELWLDEDDEDLIINLMLVFLDEVKKREKDK